MPYGEPTEITGRLRAYRAGQATWDETRDWLAGYPYADPDRVFGSAASVGTAGREVDDLGPPMVFGSFDEVHYCRLIGLLTELELLDLLRAMETRDTAARS